MHMDSRYEEHFHWPKSKKHFGLWLCKFSWPPKHNLQINQFDNYRGNIFFRENQLYYFTFNTRTRSRCDVITFGVHRRGLRLAFDLMYFDFAILRANTKSTRCHFAIDFIRVISTVKKIFMYSIV